MTAHTPTRRQFIADSATITAGALLARTSLTHAQETAPEFRTSTANDLDRIWLGQELWANPMQDWRVKSGRIECVNAAPGRNVHVLTRELADREGDLKMSVRIGRVDGGGFGGKGSAGFRIGILGTLGAIPELRDVRNNLAFSGGFDAGITAAGALFFGDVKKADTKPTGTPFNGVSSLATWLPSSTDALARTRPGVLQFSQANPSQVVIPPHAELDTPTGTISFWLRANTPLPGPGNEGAMLIDRRTTAGTVIVLNDAGAIFVQCSGGANTLTSGGYLTDNNWHHVAVTYDQSATGSLEVFIDGLTVGQQLNTAAWTWPVNQQTEVGKSHDGYWRILDGQLDDLRFYNRPLSAGEVGQIYTGDSPVIGAADLTGRYNFDTDLLPGWVVKWTGGILQSADDVMGPWADVTGAVSPLVVSPTEAKKFYRAKLQ